MKRVLICYFSCTGNTKLACEYIKYHLLNADVNLFDIRHEEVPDISSYDLVGFATYTDWCDAPLLMQNFLRWLPEQKMKPVFLFNTCAGLSGKTLKTMDKLVANRGMNVVTGFTLEAPESCPLLIIRGRTKEELPAAENLQEFNDFIGVLNKLLQLDAKELKKFKPKIGFVNSLIPRFPRKTPKLFMGRKQVATDLCNQCGQCQQVCPYQAIEMTDSGPRFVPGKCAGCWACFNKCPQKAIFTKKIKGRGHYNGPLVDYKNKLKFDKE